MRRRRKLLREKKAAERKLKKGRQGGDGVDKNTITIMSYKGQDGISVRYSNDGPKKVDRGIFNPRSHEVKQLLCFAGGRGDAKNTEKTGARPKHTRHNDMG